MQWRRGEAERFSIDSISQCTVIAANFDAGDTDDADEADDADDANDADEADDADYADDADGDPGDTQDEPAVVAKERKSRQLLDHRFFWEEEG